MNKFSTHDGFITNFYKKSNIKPYQLFYQRKELQRETKPTFNAIELNSKEYNEQTVTNEYALKAKNIIIELGKTNIYIPANEIAVLSNLLNNLITNVQSQ